ncbi:MAG: periplasmic heavy metal sensor [FCB group bacterium]|nr:periplasmic heavy metal sensor [FCB group bacterium]
MKKIIVLAMIAVFIAAPAVMAQVGPMFGQRGGHPGMGQRGFDGGERGMFDLRNCRKELDLSDDQMEKMETIRFEHQNQMIDIRADLKKAQLAKRHEMHSDNPDKNKILLIVKEVSDIKAKMAEMLVNHRFDMRDLLTQEQIDKLKECRMECRKDGGRFGHDKGTWKKSGGQMPGHSRKSRFGG